MQASASCVQYLVQAVQSQRIPTTLTHMAVPHYSYPKLCWDVGLAQAMLQLGCLQIDLLCVNMAVPSCMLLQISQHAGIGKYIHSQYMCLQLICLMYLLHLLLVLDLLLPPCSAECVGHIQMCVGHIFLTASAQQKNIHWGQAWPQISGCILDLTSITWWRNNAH